MKIRAHKNPCVKSDVKNAELTNAKVGIATPNIAKGPLPLLSASTNHKNAAATNDITTGPINPKFAIPSAQIFAFALVASEPKYNFPIRKAGDIWWEFSINQRKKLWLHQKGSFAEKKSK